MLARSSTRKIRFTVLGVALLPASALLANPSDTTYRMIFSDEFTGSTLDTNKWSAASPGWTMPNSASTASAGQVGLGNGELVLNGVRTTAGGAFTSGSVSSYQKYTMTSGYVEARLELPTTLGSWPAFWGLYTGWPPETDIMEYPLSTDGGSNGYLNNAYHTAYHYTNSSGAAAAGAGKVTTGTNLGSTGYHTFAVDWVDNTSMRFYLDGSQVSSATTSVDQMVNMYMILDYAIGGWPGTPSTTQWPVGFSDQFKVDWVHVWQHNANSDAASTWNINGGGAFTTAGNWTGAGVPTYGNQPVVFGRVGATSLALISMGAWQMMGNITFNGDGTGTTAYTLGSSTNTIQLSSTTGSFVTASSTSTANQTIAAKVDLITNTTFRNDMTGATTLSFTGGVTGPGALTVEGAGTIVLSNTGTYTGGTNINGGAAGPGVLRVSAKNAMGTGNVVIGANGNGTTARLELTGSVSHNNNIDLRGRNNPSPGIQNISGNNTIHGTISTNVGGGTYQIQSDSGSLTLTGTAANATSRGTAIQSGATGTRTVTLQGAGNGFVTGLIKNGSATTLNLVKDGTGTWTLSNYNSYTGSTTVTAGTLKLSYPATSVLPTPIAKYTFANVSGTTVVNEGSGGTAMNGTLNPNGGTGSINVTGGPVTGLGSLNLNGTGTTVDIASGITSLNSTSSWTVSSWVKTSQLGATILNKGDGSGWTTGYSTFFLGSTSNGGIGGTPGAVRYAGGFMSGTTQVADGNWHLLTYTNSAGTKTIYVDGVAETMTQTGVTTNDTGTLVRLGFSPLTEVDGNVATNGSLSNVNFYSSALSAAQVAYMYNNTFATTGSLLPASTALTISSGATLDMAGVQQSVASLTGDAGANIAMSNGQLTVNTTSNTAYNGNMSGLLGQLIKTGTGTLTTGGTLSYTGATTVSGGRLITTNAIKNNAAINISNSSTLEVPANGGSTGVMAISSLSIGSGSKLVLHDNDLIANYGVSVSSYSNIVSLVKSGLQILGGAGATGITSTEVDSQSLQGTMLAVVDDGDPTIGGQITSLSGYTIPNPTASVLVKYTWFGDSNLDGTVDGSDYALLDSGFTSGGSLTGWIFGDYDYNNLIDGSDYALIDTGFISQSGVLPEPATLGLFGLSAIQLIRRRRLPASCGL